LLVAFSLARRLGREHTEERHRRTTSAVRRPVSGVATAPTGRRGRRLRLRRSQIVHRRAGALAAVLLLAGAAPAPAGAAAVPEPGELEPLVDRLVAGQLEEFDVPGAVVVIVRDGEVLLRKGYGHTDLERRAPVDPERTRFDIGSVTKLFTATAVMQLVERGELDLGADVNRYLREVRVPDTFPEPITTAHLLTHTAGFAERLFVGMVAGSPEEVGPLGENLARHLPPRIRPPGELHQYNNHGMALAGLVVEELAGRPFDEVVAAEILRPLGMTRTTFGEPPDAPVEDATGHEDTTGPTTAVDPVYISTRPAGGLWSTGTDMAAFMLAHLQEGEHGGARILEADTVREMQRTQFRSHPAVSGIGYGFFELRSDGRRAVQHGGGWIGFGSMLRLLPEEGFGLFVSYNHGRGQQLGTELADAVVDQLFPAPTFEGEPAAGAAERAQELAGDYRWTRRDRHTYMSLLSALTTSRIEVTAGSDGSLATTMWPWKLIADTRWIEDEPGVFREAGGTKTLAFDLDGDGRPTRLHVAGAQLFVMEPVAWHQSTRLTIGLLAFFVAVLLLAAIGWPAGRLTRRLRRRRAPAGSPASADLRRVRLLTGLAGASGLAFLLGFAVHFAADQVGLFNVSPALRLLLLLPLLAAALAIAAAASVVLLWLRHDGAVAARLYHSGVVLALLALIPFLHYWRLLGFHY
jgi:CubicO group peptidase (beta-lactamase class C family)